MIILFVSLLYFFVRQSGTTSVDYVRSCQVRIDRRWLRYVSRVTRFTTSSPTPSPLPPSGHLLPAAVSRLSAGSRSVSHLLSDGQYFRFDAMLDRWLNPISRAAIPKSHLHLLSGGNHPFWILPGLISFFNGSSLFDAGTVELDRTFDGRNEAELCPVLRPDIELNRFAPSGSENCFKPVIFSTTVC